MFRRIIAILLLSTALVGCFKDVALETAYILKPLVQERSGEEILPIEGAVAYAFEVDTTEWTVASYEDAFEGVITNKTTSERNATPYAASTPYTAEGATGWISLPVSKAEQMVLVADPTSQRYAYTQVKKPENLPSMYVSLVFRLWKEGRSYLDGKWSFYNEFYATPTYLDLFVDAAVENAEGAEKVYLASSRMNVYAYAADTLQWRIASYDDAAAGVITSKNDPEQQRMTPSFQGYKQSASDLYKITVSEPVLMVVVVDKLNRIYAYTKREIDLEGASPTLELILRPWQEIWKQTEEDWVVINEKFAPEDESNTTEDQVR